MATTLARLALFAFCTPIAASVFASGTNTKETCAWRSGQVMRYIGFPTFRLTVIDPYFVFGLDPNKSMPPELEQALGDHVIAVAGEFDVCISRLSSLGVMPAARITAAKHLVAFPPKDHLPN